jgi:hypothetical protein
MRRGELATFQRHEQCTLEGLGLGGAQLKLLRGSAALFGIAKRAEC